MRRTMAVHFWEDPFSVFTQLVVRSQYEGIGFMPLISIPFTTEK